MSFVKKYFLSSVKLLFFFAFKLCHTEIITCYAKNDNPPPEKIDAFICTHLLVIGSTGLSKQSGYSFPNVDVIKRYNRLKSANPDLKILVTLSPENQAASELSSNESKTVEYARVVKQYLLDNQLDGFDIDWEFPVFSHDASPSDKDGFSKLLMAMRTEFDLAPRKLLLSVAVAAPFTVAEKAYDIAALNQFCDMVQVMNYDFHVYNPFADPLVGFNAPLHKEPYEVIFLDRINTEYTTKLYLEKGLDRSKLIFGIPTYGRGYTLALEILHFPYAPAVGVSSLGEYIPFRRSCKLQQSNDYNYVFDEHAASPYLYKGRDWLSVEDERSVRLKAEFARDLGVGGVMVFALDSDDFDAGCGPAYPLIRAIRGVFVSEEEVQRRRTAAQDASNQVPVTPDQLVIPDHVNGGNVEIAERVDQGNAVRHRLRRHRPHRHRRRLTAEALLQDGRALIVNS